MAKKAELLEKAQSLGLEVTAKNTIAEIESAINAADVPANEEKEDVEKAPVAKAGKRSAKAIAEAEAAEAKEQRKAKIAAGELDPSQDGVTKGPAPKTRLRSERRSKNYKAAVGKIDTSKSYSLAEGVAAAKSAHVAKFDASVELHIRLNVDPKQADQNIRGSLVLPNGTGKTVRVAVFGNQDDIKAAKSAGADVAGEADFLEQLKKEIIDFDVLISSPQMMAQLGRFARLLGPKGLMPNPKSGTVTKDIAGAVTQAKAGMVEYRVDPSGIIHMAIGKVSFEDAKLAENAEALMSAIQSAKPGSIKGVYIESIYASTSMGPSVQITI